MTRLSTAGELPDESLACACLVQRHGRRRARELLVEHGSARTTLAVQGIDAGQRALIATLHEQPDGHRHYLLVETDPLYPPPLRQIPDPPLVLFVAGAPDILLQPCVAVVGARRCSRSGAAHARGFARDLAALGVTVVSGLALGIDGAAHRGALEAGRTAAVLGAGLARIYPSAHRKLAAEILEHGGVLVSEYPPGQQARAYQFPERNRVISGLSCGVLVVEAGERSGSLITARMALEQGRDVLAVPGSIDNPASRGCHRLLRDGAALVESLADVLTALGLERPPIDIAGAACGRVPEPALAHALAEVGWSPTTIDELVAATGRSAGDLAAQLLELELAGFVEQVPGGYIRRPVD